ncbi:MAG: diguanylate cyclase [Trueperaceae bacterium]|nr:MAG: diguanylate cyclase [Trueperaceae bacterium]
MAHSPTSLEHTPAAKEREAHLAEKIAVAWERSIEHPKEALALAREAQQLAERQDDTVAKAITFCLSSIAYRNLGREAETQRTALEALESLQISSDQEQSVWDRVLKGLGKSDLLILSQTLSALVQSAFHQTDYPTSLTYANLELYLKRQLGDRRGEAVALQRIGRAYGRVGLYQRALEHHFDALTLFEKEALDEVGWALDDIAGIYIKVGQLDKALEYARKSIDASAGNGDGTLICSALRHIGTVQQKFGEFDAARESFEQGLAVADEEGSALIRLSLGNMFLEQNLYEAALENFQACLENMPADPFKHHRTQALIGLGRVHFELADYPGAIRYFENALGYAEQMKAAVETYQAHQGLSRTHRRLGEVERSLTHFEAYHHAKERVTQEASDVRTQLLMIQFDVERLQKDQEIHRLRTVELARAYSELKSLNAQLERQAKELEQLSIVDDLTGLYNRRYLDTKLGYEFARATRYRHSLAVIICDIDDFKEINDRFSHVGGDEVLKVLATIFKSNTRDTDIVARFGGEEFVIIFPNISKPQARQAGEKIRRIVAEYPWNELRQDLTVTISIGLAEKSEAADASTLIQLADDRLYQAKRAGKNRVVS